MKQKQVPAVAAHVEEYGEADYLAAIQEARANIARGVEVAHPAAYVYSILQGKKADAERRERRAADYDDDSGNADEELLAAMGMTREDIYDVDSLNV